MKASGRHPHPQTQDPGPRGAHGALANTHMRLSPQHLQPHPPGPPPTTALPKGSVR